MKCDQNRPYCGNCVRRNEKKSCVYRDLFDTIHKPGASTERPETTPSDEACDTPSSDDRPVVRFGKTLFERVIDTNLTTETESTHSNSVGRPLEADNELESLCFFFSNYVNIPREAHSNIFVEHILPLYKGAAPNSPLKDAVAAAASNVAQMWRMMGPHSTVAQKAYGRALRSLREAMSDSNVATTDEILGAIFMLDWYESLNRRFEKTNDRDVHQRAAMAIVQQRGAQSFSSENSRRLLAALRTRYILFNLQARRKVEIDEAILAEDVAGHMPGPKLDVSLSSRL